MKKNSVKRTERGWPGHFCCAHRCLFRRNTLLELNDIRIVISTVGAMLSLDEKNIEEIGLDRYYETMAFHAQLVFDKYWDADVSKQAYFDSDWSISEKGADYEANEMHEAVVDEITERLLNGEYNETV
jgi:hypothetical protein